MTYKNILSYILKVYTLALFMFCLMYASCLGGPSEPNAARLARILAAAGPAESPGDRIVALSRQFLGTPYAADTLVGGPGEAELLVINLEGFDCFTLLDTVEALRRSASADDFPARLRSVRYRHATVAYQERRHFFSDWVADGEGPLSDVTQQIGQGRAKLATKQLNLRDDGALWLAGIPVSRRDIFYIPVELIDQQLLTALQPGDYVGIYSRQGGLDVSHTGLVVKDTDRIMLRHASSRRGVDQVVDEELFTYLQGKPGLLVYRVKQ